MSRRSIVRALALATATSVLFACGDRDDEVRAAPKLSAEPVTLDSATAARRASLEPGMLATVQAVPVNGFKGPGGKPFEVALRSAVPEAGHTRQFGTIALPVALRSRSASVNQYPCSSCHAGRTVTMAAQRIGDAHQNVKAVHPVRVGARLLHLPREPRTSRSSCSRTATARRWTRATASAPSATSSRPKPGQAADTASAWMDGRGAVS